MFSLAINRRGCRSELSLCPLCYQVRFSRSLGGLGRLINFLIRFIPDLISTAEVLGPLLKCTDTFVLIQNGIGVELGLRETVGTDATIISACAWVDATIVDGGTKLTHGRLVSTLKC